jgi:glyoxylase-like metal-dependent hydrolase (beta-lactamase superfamily II)
MQNFGYLIGDDTTRRALIVDPAWDPTQLLKIAADGNWTIAGFIITHAHYDHVNAIDPLLFKLDVPVYANKAEIPYSNSSAGIVGDLGRTVKGMNGGDVIELGDTEIKLLHTPGHTPGSQCVQVGNHLITGDTLFIGGCGRADLPGGDAGTLYKSLQKIAQLPGDLEVCPGHDYGDAPRRLLRDEMKINPYLRLRDEDDFVTNMS